MFLRSADNTDPASISSRLRRKRIEALDSLLGDFAEPVRILDVGGSIGFWKQHAGTLSKRCQITALNQKHSGEISSSDLTEVLGDARTMPQYATGLFDVCFSNSVIEHVGTLYDQMAMAQEIRRVARSYFVQTPYRYFPLEPHFLLPLWQFYPVSLRSTLHGRFTLGWMRRQGDPLMARAEVEQLRLLTVYEMSRCFPDAEILCERIGPFTKSLFAIRRSPAP
jgi:hypothetical protein